MTRFRYRAVDAAGRACKGQLDAPDASAARGTLRAQGLLPTQVAVARGARLSLSLGQELWSARRISPADVALFTRQMATLISGGVQIEAALGAVAAQSPPRLAALCQATRRTILDGGSLSAALTAQSGRFDRFYLTSVQSGEVSGQLGAVFSHLADHVEAGQRHRQTVTLALIYPAILIAVSVAVVIALLVFVLPDIVRVFAARGAELPPLTRAMIALSEGLSRYGAILVLVLAGIVGGALVLLRKPGARRVLDRGIWRLGLARQVVLVQFTGTLATLTQSGVTLTDALTAATSTVSNLEARATLTQVTHDVREGAALSRALAAQSGFPPMMITMIASGEASGSLPALLGRFWQDQSQTLQARIKTLVGLVEPLVLLLMGGVVMLLVLAILLPIVNLNTLVG